MKNLFSNSIGASSARIVLEVCMRDIRGMCTTGYEVGALSEYL